MNTFRDLIAYQKGFLLSMEIFNLSKGFPSEEKYSLIDQVRMSSRSTCACIAEAYRKRLFEAHFISKLSDADMEHTETQVWLDFSMACKYISKITYNELIKKSEEVGKLIGYMMNNSAKFQNSFQKNYQKKK